MKTVRLLAHPGLGVLLAVAVVHTAFAQSAAVLITTQPANRAVTVGATATFSVVAMGIPPLTYQWRRGTTNIPGATSASYTTPITVLSDNGSTFLVVVTNPSGPVTSNPATLTVNPKASVDVEGPGGVIAGQPATFTASASGGTPPFTYQWYRNAILPANIIPGATSATYILPRATRAGDHESKFFVRITDASGIVTDSEVEELLVFPESQTITFTAPNNPVVSPTPIALVATASSGLPVTFSILSGGPASISGNNLTLSSVGNVVVRASQGGNLEFHPAPAVDRTLVVGRGNQTITFAAPSNPVVSPNAIALSAVASSGLAVTLSVTGPASLFGSNLTLTGVGNVTVRAAQAGNANYNAATTVERSFTVNKGTPVITWPTPAAVVDGATLGAAQLNATANVPGTFVYNPASGTVVRAPSQVLAAVFTPTDTTNYNNVSAQQTLAVSSPANPARLTNVSVRTTLAAAQILIVGFTMQGGAKPILLRAVGPGLTSLGVPGVMADPRIAIFRDATQLAFNDNWGGDATLGDAFTRVGAFPLAATSLDSALLRAIEGGHTAQITGGGGTVLVEGYDAGSGPSPRLTNISARNRVGTGSDILIAGFTIGGTGERNLLVRAVGPTLANLGVSGVLVDPQLAIYSGATKIAENDTWNPTLAGTFTSVGAFALSPGSKDAALAINLPAGSYTVQVSGADGGTGEAVVEVYELP